MNVPKIEVVDFGSNCRLGVCLLCLICFWFYVYLSTIFSAYYHWWICLLIWLLSSFFIYTYTFFPFSLFMSVYVYASLCDIVCKGLLLSFVLEFCLFVLLFSFSFSSVCFFFYLPFLLSSLAGRVLVPRPGVRPETSRREG